MGSLLRTILIFAIVYYLIKKVGGFFVRTVAGSEDSQGNTNNKRTYTNTNYQQYQRREGEIRIDRKPDQPKKGAADYKGGEYVDYEEVK